MPRCMRFRGDPASFRLPFSPRRRCPHFSRHDGDMLLQNHEDPQELKSYAQATRRWRRSSYTEVSLRCRIGAGAHGTIVRSVPFFRFRMTAATVGLRAMPWQTASRAPHPATVTADVRPRVNDICLQTSEEGAGKNTFSPRARQSAQKGSDYLPLVRSLNQLAEFAWASQFGAEQIFPMDLLAEMVVVGFRLSSKCERFSSIFRLLIFGSSSSIVGTLEHSDLDIFSCTMNRHRADMQKERR